jgi:quinoprotein relay system zinc metallohydrolase 2
VALSATAWRAAVLGLAISLLASAALAAEPLPVSEIAPGIYVHAGAQEEATAANEGAIANVGFIVGEDAVMVVDTGGSRAEGGRLRAAVRRVTPRPIRYVVLTHVHPDHIFGTAAFAQDAPEIIGHAKLPGALAQRGAYYLRTLQRDLGKEAAGSEVVAPTRLVAKMDAIDLGGRRIVIRAHGPAHTDNDLSLYDEKTKTLWLSDLLFVERIPVIDGSLAGWLRELEALEAMPAARAVPGHGPASVPWPLAAAPQKRYLLAVLDDTRAAIKAGVEIGDAPRRVARGEDGRWLLFDDYHARNVITAYKELEWE